MSYDRRSEGQPTDHNRLSFAWLEITNRCNLTCRHCYADAGPHESSTGTMGYNDWCCVMDEMRALGCEGVQFIGGEPTLHPRFLDLVSAARKKCFDLVEVYTNATRLSSTMCAELKRLNVKLAVSFYASDEATHDRITGRHGSFTKTIRGITEAVRHGIPIRVGIVVMDENAAQINEAKEIVTNLGVASVKVDNERHIGRSGKSTTTVDPMGQLCGSCGKQLIAINAEGEVSPCVFSHFYRLGHVSEGISTILHRPNLEEFGKQLKGSRVNMACSPGCGPHECGPGDDPSPACFPNGCDPDMCDPISCPPRD
jgi:MoaA/NifB/PqqE/SkfB family radical SAM enzyme